MTDITKQLAEALRDAAQSLETIAKNAGKRLDSERQENMLAHHDQVRGYANSRAGVAREALAAHDAEQAAQAVPADMLPSAEHIKEIAGELVTQAMEQAQVFASAWALVGSRFDAGNEMDNAEQQKADLRTIIQTLADLAAETVRPIAAAPAAPAPEAQAARAALAQRQPLTDEQIESIRAQVFAKALQRCDGCDHETWDHWFARAIEAAHGIAATTGEQR